VSGRRRRTSLFSHPGFRAAIALLSLLCAAPGGCGSGQSNAIDPGTPPNTIVNLTVNDVNTIVLQAIHEAAARGAPATIAVVDRVGNVLTLTQMAGAPTMATVTSGRGVPTTSVPPPPENGLEGVPVPTTLAAIAKALTGAYLSSDGNAFSTRTANQIIQEHFNPGVKSTPGGPLFGVQFSQLPCSDFNTVATAVPGTTNAGPHRSPLGFSADSGGLPIYKSGVLVGGIGVISKNTYSDNLNIFAVPIDNDEVIALAGTANFAAPPTITADNIAVGGLTLQYTDATLANLAAPISAVGSFTPMMVPGYFAGATTAGLTYGSPDGLSGIAPDGALGAMLYPGTIRTSFVFTNGAGTVLYPPTAGLAPGGGQAITAAEARALMTSALNVAYEARAGIRIPTNTFVQVTVTIVDLDGNVLAQARTPDAPIFGADVSRQKARSAVFFSRLDAAAKINAITAPASTVPGTFADYITRSQQLLGATVFANGIAWSEVSVGDIARPFFPDGIDGNPPGSLSLPISRWSVFSTGLQTDLIVGDIVRGTTGAAPPATGCANLGPSGEPELPPTPTGAKTQLANGLQIFSGAVPIYRGNVLVGGIGVSGDGIQQDSMVSFLGLQNVGPSFTINNAPANIRADQLAPGGVHLRYINCPQSPFLDSTLQNPC
jgi:uncharacterized protein GlcG (DUF336 family)